MVAEFSLTIGSVQAEPASDPLLSNRELASAILFAAFVCLTLILAKRSDRLRPLTESLIAALSVLARPKLAIPLLLYVALIMVALVPAERSGIWEPTLWKTTVIWLLLSGLGLLFNLNDAISRPDFFRRALTRTLGLAVIFEFIANLESFSLWVEIPAQGLAFLALLIMAAGADERSEAPAKIARAYLALLGLAALGWGIWNLADGWSASDHYLVLKEFLLPIWLTPTALLLVYAYAVLAAYETTFMRMRIAEQGKSLWRQRLAVVLRTHILLPRLRLIHSDGANRVARTLGFREAWHEVGQLGLDRRAEIEGQAAATLRLAENARRVGLDEFGLQLDQREHVDTRAALQRLATSQMGHYRNGTRRYRPDLLPILESGSARGGLPQPSGISMYVSADGQGCYAERETITGHWFAIGAVGPPSDQWLFDGPDKPTGFPTETEWDHWGGGEHSVNWE